MKNINEELNEAAKAVALDYIDQAIYQTSERIEFRVFGIKDDWYTSRFSKEFQAQCTEVDIKVLDYLEKLKLALEDLK